MPAIRNEKRIRMYMVSDSRIARARAPPSSPSPPGAWPPDQCAPGSPSKSSLIDADCVLDM